MMQYFFLSSLVLLCNQYLYSGVQSVIVRDGTPLNNDRPPDGVAYCVDVTKEDSTCSSNPVEVLQGLHDQKTFEGISPGIVQRIDGTEEEKNSIMEILRLMNSYWYDEVLSNIEYADIRTSWCVYPSYPIGIILCKSMP